MSGDYKTRRTMTENVRADYAYRAVEKRAKSPGAGSYKSHVKRLPTLIQVNGLGQTLAFCKQKKKEYKDVYDDFHQWLIQAKPDVINETDDLVGQVIKLESKEYREVTRETLALLNWMRKFADGMIEKESSEENG